MPERLLVCAEAPPFPRDRGDRVRYGHFLDVLRTTYDVRFVLIRREEAVRANPVPEAVEVGLTRAEVLAAVARGVVSRAPVQFAAFKNRRAERAIASQTEEVDGVVVFGARAALNLPRAARRLPLMLDLPDSLVLNGRAHWRAGSGLLRKLYGTENLIKAPGFERRLLQTFDMVTVASPADEIWLRHSVPSISCRVIPTAVAVGETEPAPPSEEGRVLFIGDLRFAPNIDAVHFLVSKIWPRVADVRPDAALDVVGHAPDPPLRRFLENARVRTAFSVPDVEPYLRRACVVVAPMRVGSGIKVKVLTAMASGRPVVMTSGANDGIGAEDGREAIVADTPDALASGIVRLLADPSHAERIGAGGRRVVLQNFSPASVGEKLLAAVAETLTSAAARRG